MNCTGKIDCCSMHRAAGDLRWALDDLTLWFAKVNPDSVTPENELDYMHSGDPETLRNSLVNARLALGQASGRLPR